MPHPSSKKRLNKNKQNTKTTFSNFVDKKEPDFAARIVDNVLCFVVYEASIVALDLYPNIVRKMLRYRLLYKT